MSAFQLKAWGRKPPPGEQASRGYDQRLTAQASFVIPAYNAAATLGRTLECLGRQTCPAWEVIIVDDGSTDGTAAVARAASVQDPRIRSVTQANAGVCAARNRGLAQAGAEWVVFLDADDYLSPRFLEIMLATLAQDAEASVASCGYARTNREGEVLLTGVPDFQGDPFSCFASRSMGTIHSFMVRRALVVEVGGFAPELSTCEDWDLYQRVFRTGAKLAQTSEILAFYEGRPGSLSRNGARMVGDARTVFLRGCGPDPRVPRPDPRYAMGARQARSVDYTCLWMACWCAATAIGAGERPPALLDDVGDFSDTDHLGGAVFEGLVVGSGRPPAALGLVWSSFAGAVAELAADVAARAGDAGRSRAILEGLALVIASAGSAPDGCLVGPVLVAPFRAALVWRGLDVPAGADCVILQFKARNRLLHLPTLGRLSGEDILAALIERLSWRVARLALNAGRRALRTLFQLARSRGPSRRTSQGRRLAAIAEQERRAAQDIVLPASADSEAARSEPRETARFEDRDAYWEQLFETADPWNYASPYEQLKYERTLSLIPDGPVDRALELACAEGRFTAQLAGRVGALKAIDISRKALDRAQERCAGLQNVQFARQDFFAEPIEGEWDLIVCSEVLYFLNDRDALAAFAGRLRDALREGGHLLTAHTNLLADESGHTGFEWDHAFGSRTVATVLGGTEGLAHVTGLRTPLYRIDLFRRAAKPEAEGGSYQYADVPLGPLPTTRVQRSVVWGGAIMTRSDCNRTLSTPDLPILMYHQVAPGPESAPERFRISQERFEQQLRFLRRRGFRPVGLDEWAWTACRAGRFDGRPVMLTFDDATTDFQEIAWPILERNGFSASVFVVTGKVGGVADWAGAKHKSAAVMDWDAIRRLSLLGVEFGSHMAAHVATDGVGTEDVLRSGARSKATLERALGRPIDAVALPYGVTSGRVRQLMKVCGYTSAFTATYGVASTGVDMLDVPRIEISGEDDLEAFARKLQLPRELYPDANDLRAPT